MKSSPRNAGYVGLTFRDDALGKGDLAKLGSEMSSYIYIYISHRIYIYIYTPGTQRTLVLNGKSLTMWG